MDEIATIVTREAGMPKWLSHDRAGRPPDQLVQHRPPRWPRRYQYEETVGNSLVVREPVGVVGCITPWNYPLHQIAAKVAYAMAAGCTVVLKPSEIAPLDAYILAEVINDVGLPAGRVQPRDRHRRRASARRSPPTPTSTWCRSPARPAPASASPRSRRRRSSASPSSSGGKSANILLDDLDDDGFEKAVRDGIGKALPQPGPDLHRAHPHARAQQPHRPTPSASPPTRSRPSSSPSDPFADGAMLGPAVVAGAGRAGAPATSRRASTRAPSSSPVAPASPRASTQTATS